MTTNWDEMDRWAMLEEFIVGAGIGCILAIFVSVILGHLLLFLYGGFWSILLSDTVAQWVL